MLNSQQKVILPHLCRMIGAQFGGELSDGDLLERFRNQHDAEAFAALVRRHGPMVLGVCRRILRNVHDAEDAFQAAFLVLARQSRGITKQEALASWLYGVAYRVALKARANSVRRRKHERQAAERNDERTRHHASHEDLHPILDEEVNRLPDKYRQPIVLCYFEGKTYQEAARLLGWPAGTASVRLARARELLRTRLRRRGLPLASGVLTAWLTESVASADACLLAEATADVAVRFVTDPATAGVSTMVMPLTQGVVKAMAMHKAKTLAAVCLVLGLMSGSVGTLRYLAQETPAAEPPVSKAEDSNRTSADKKIAQSNRTYSTRDLVIPASPLDRSLTDAADGKIGAPPQSLAPPGPVGARTQRTRIGLINMTRVLKSSKKMKAMRDEQREYIDQVRKKLDTLKTAYQNYLEAANHTTQPDERAKYEPKLRELKRQLEEEEISAKQHITKQSGKVTVQIYRAIEEAANRIAKANDLELVMFYTDAVTEADFYTPENLQRKLTQNSALVPMIVAPGMDITETVIEALNRMHDNSSGK